MPKIQDSQRGIWTWVAVFYFVTLVLVYLWASSNASPGGVHNVSYLLLDTSLFFHAHVDKVFD